MIHNFSSVPFFFLFSLVEEDPPDLNRKSKRRGAPLPNSAVNC